MLLNTAIDTDDLYANATTPIAAIVIMVVDTLHQTLSIMFFYNTMMATSILIMVTLLTTSSESAVVPSNLLLEFGNLELSFFVFLISI